MNRFWIVAAVLLVALIGFIYSQERMMGCDTVRARRNAFLGAHQWRYGSGALLLRRRLSVDRGANEQG
jgi:hypothetical protein